MPLSAQTLIAPVARWSQFGCLAGAEASAAPDVGFVEPMLRRRLSPMARMVLRVAEDCAANVADARMVFASRHGELARTTTMLDSLARDEALSPTLFGMSVLNSSVGLYSILKKNTAPATAISAGAASFCYGLMEACLQLAERPEQPVLYVYADEPVPSRYGAVDPVASPAHAVGVLLEAGAPVRIACRFTEGDGAVSADAPAPAFLRCLSEAGCAQWRESERVWSWERDC